MSGTLQQYKYKYSVDESDKFFNTMPHVFEETLKNYEDTFQEQQSKLSAFHRKILIICTGGTISMLNNGEGFKVQKGSMTRFLRENPYICDQDFTFFNSKDDFLITPETIFKKRIWYKIIEFDNCIDSSNMNCEYYVQIAESIEQNYKLYDGFVILHGTDTLAYTTSALSFMLENLSKTVIVTGAMLPISAMRNDGFSNLLTSLTIAGHFTIPEVLLVFADKMFRGNRCTKKDTQSIDAFDSPNIEPIGTIMGMMIDIKWDIIRSCDTSKPMTVQKKICDKIAVVKFYPQISSETLDSVFKNKETKAIVLETYGLGDMPTNRPQINQLIKDAIDNGIIIVNVSQCYRSIVKDDVYETGIHLQKLGVIPGQDMTVESALSKLSYLIGKYGNNIQEVKRNMILNLRGELTPQSNQNIFEMKKDQFFQGFKEQNISAEAFNNKDILNEIILPNIVCQVINKAEDQEQSDVCEALEQLKIYGTDFFSLNYDQRTSLHFAAINGKQVLIQFLLNQIKQNDSNPVNIEDVYGYTALFYAIINKNKEAISLIRQKGGKIKSQKNSLIQYLFNAVKNNDMILLQCFLDGGLTKWENYINIDQRNIGHIAVAENKLEIIKFLNEKCSFQFNQKDIFGRTALQEAKMNNFTEIEQYLESIDQQNIININ